VKIGVISDTHNLVRPEVFNAFDGVDLIAHAGDIGDQDVLIELETLAPVKAVLGNNDWGLPARYKEQLSFKLCEKNILIQHICKNIPEENEGNNGPVQNIVIFGHSHKPLSQQVGDTLFFNPGSAGPKRFDLPITVGLLQLGDESVKNEIITLIKE
jgi:putative phosphoesterase